MDASFWHERWEANQLGFHQNAPNRMLVGHMGALNLKENAHVFVPLCGKTLDIGWLLAQGFRVTGAELSELAIQQLFADLDVEPSRTPVGTLVRYSAPMVDVYVGDIFDLTAETLGSVDAVYDRAALIALPDDMRARYAAHLMEVTGRAPQLVVAVEYDQSVMPGPPFSVVGAEVTKLYQADYAVSEVNRAEVPGRLKGIVDAEETAWLLS